MKKKMKHSGPKKSSLYGAFLAPGPPSRWFLFGAKK